MELSTWILFGIFCFCLLIFGVLDKLSKSAKKYGDLLYCVANAFKDYSLCFLVSSIVDFFCTNIFNSGIFSMIIDIESVGIKVLILLVIIGWLVKVAYINRNIYKTILIKRVRFENDNGQLKNCCKQLSLSKKQQKRKLEILLKFAPLTVITIFLQNLTGIIEKKSIPDILDLMVTNKLNIILLSLLFGYLLLIYNTNKQLKILEDTLFYLKEYSYKNKKTKNKKVFYE